MPVFVETYTVLVCVGGQTVHTVLFWGSHYDESDEFRLHNLMPCADGFST